MLNSGSVICDQLVIYNPANSFTRDTGIVISDLTLTLFVNNVSVNWSLVDGSSILDYQISPGYIYFNEISGNPGFYSLRFFPDRIGYWNLSLVYSGTTVEYVREFDVVPAGSFGSTTSGLVTSFT